MSAERPTDRAGAGVEAAIRAWLEEAAVPFEVIDHPPGASAAEIARARGTSLAIGGKSLVMKLDRDIGFAMVVVGGDRRVDNRQFRRVLGVRRLRFATAEELGALTGLVPGRVPPFGRPIFDLPLFVDAGLAAQPEIAFTPGRADRSFRLSTADWLRVAAPVEVAPLVRGG